MIDLNKYKSFRLKPSQARGKERIRVILAAAMHLFRERGVDQVTTNDIAGHAGVPIGSVYRYFKNKDEIILALTELYVDDVTAMLDDIAQHPMLPRSSWQEIMLLVADSWGYYSRINGSFSFLWYIECDPALYQQSSVYRDRIALSFARVARAHYAGVSNKHAQVACRLMWSGVEHGASQADDFGHETAKAIAFYLTAITKNK